MLTLHKVISTRIAKIITRQNDLKAERFGFMSLGLVGLRTFQLSAWIT